jgi:nicotinate phosphoribosyltransferase
MMNGYVETNTADKKAIFDLFYRVAPGLDFAVVAGLEQAIQYINDLRFDDDDIAYLKSLNLFGDKFFKKIHNFKFTGSIRAMREGEIVFPSEPIMTVTATLFECQLVETALLNIINHQTLIATKALKVTQETDGGVAEFGLRRAQGADAGVYGARAAMIGGCKSTSNVLAGKMFGVKVTGTMSHSWILGFESEEVAFRTYARIYPNNCLLLVDTYDTLHSGVPNAIKIFAELRASGHKPVGIRLDSGDLAYLSREARIALDNAGFSDAKIFASGDIDENIIASLKTQDAKIDMWGIGTKLITSYSTPSLGGVFKLAGIYENDKLIPKMKFSDTQEKITNPGDKTVLRIYKKDGMAAADLIALKNEVFDTNKSLTIFHPIETWKSKTFTEFSLRELPVDIFKDGECVYNSPTIEDIILYAKKCKDEFWPEYKRLINPHVYKVDLSDGLYTMRQALLKKNMLLRSYE